MIFGKNINNKNLQLASSKISLVLIIMFTFLLFAIAGYGWHFYKEEIDLFYAATKIKSLKDLFACFLSGNVSGNAHPSNYAPPQLTFFTSFYRPLLFVFAFIQYSLLGMYPYAHYLVSIGLHTLNIPLMFYLLTNFVSNTTALMCTLLFAVHPSFATWLGNANMQQYTISTTCMIVVALLVKKYLILPYNRFLFGAALLFGPTLFIRETIIVAPIIIGWISLMSIISWRKASTLIVTFMLASIPYLAAKLAIFPLSLAQRQATSFTNVSAKPSLWAIQIRTFLYDFLSISWLQGYPKIKATVVIALLVAIVILFFKNPKKRLIIAALGCMTLLLWPGIMIGYFIPSRFFYEITPAYLLAITLLIEHTKPRVKKITGTIMGILIMGSLGYTMKTVHEHTQNPKLFYQAIMQLKNNPLVHDHALCFFNLPDNLSWTGLAQQLWLYKINNQKQIFVLTPDEPQWNTFPAKTTFITWDYTKNEFYVPPPATSNATAVLTSTSEKPA